MLSLGWRVPIGSLSSSPVPRSPERGLRPGVRRAATVTLCAGPLPTLVTTTLNSTSWPLRIFRALGTWSIFSRGWRTSDRALMPVWKVTEAPCSSGPAWVGSTFTVITLSVRADRVPSDQVSAEAAVPSPDSGGGTLETNFSPSGSSSRTRTCRASEVPVLRTKSRTSAGLCRFMCAGDWMFTETATDCLPAGSRSIGSRSPRSAPGRCRRVQRVRRRVRSRRSTGARTGTGAPAGGGASVPASGGKLGVGSRVPGSRELGPATFLCARRLLRRAGLS